MREAGHVVALVVDGGDAETTRTDLRRSGVHAEVVAAPPGVYEVADQTFGEHVRSGLRGLAVGAAIGALIGLVASVSAPGLRELGWAAQLLLVGGIALQGTMPGIMWGMGRVEHYDDDPAVTRRLDVTDRLVVVHDLHDEPHAHRVMREHDAVFLTDDKPVRLVSANQ